MFSCLFVKVGTDAIVTRAINDAKTKGMCKTGDLVVCVHGTHEHLSGSTNLVRVLVVE